MLFLFSLGAVFCDSEIICFLDFKVPLSISEIVLIISLEPISISLSWSSPAVCPSLISVFSINNTSPVSILSLIKNVVTPDSFSPFIIAQLIGAAPL